MEDLYMTLTEALAAWVGTVTGAKVAAADFRVPRHEGQLSLGAFVRGGAEEAAARLAGALCPQVRAVQERNVQENIKFLRRRINIYQSLLARYRKEHGDAD